MKEYYNNGNIRFEGEYINDERNGMGKEYDPLVNKLEFEGEYLNGLKWSGKWFDKYDNNKILFKLTNGKGYGKFFYDGKLEFEGEYFNGDKNGKGKEYYNDGSLKFEGEYLNGLRWIGIGYHNGNMEYQLINGNGKIKDFYSNGKISFE